MALTERQQLTELIRKNNSFLITFKKDWTGDDLAGALALAFFLKKMEKKVDIACQNFQISEQLNFLPADMVKANLDGSQNITINVNTEKVKIGQFSYEQTAGKFKIHLSPQVGKFELKDFFVTRTNFQYDLIFTIATPDLNSLADIYNKNQDLFFKRTKINIDCHSNNEYYGNINLIDLTAASTSEIIYHLIKEIDEKALDENIATCLLTGLILDTKNFKSNQVTPQALFDASILITKGAKREEIIKKLYYSRFLSTLKLWGRVLSKLNSTSEEKIIWASLTAQDFMDTGTSAEELKDIVEELIISLPKAELIILIYENQPGICALIHSLKNYNAFNLCQKFNPEGNSQLARIKVGQGNLQNAEQRIIDELKAKIK